MYKLVSGDSSSSNRPGGAIKKRKTSKFKLTGKITNKPWIKPNGDIIITRCVTPSITYGGDGKFQLNAFTSSGFTMLFSSQYVTLTTSSTNSIQYPVPNASEIAALYDQLKIIKVEILFTTATDNSVTSATSSGPRFMVANDYNDSGTTTTASVAQLGGVGQFTAQGPQGFRWTCKPKYQQLVYYNATTSSYAPRSGYVNSDTDIPHYGVKVANAYDYAAQLVLQGFLFMQCKIFYGLRDVK